MRRRGQGCRLIARYRLVGGGLERGGGFPPPGREKEVVAVDSLTHRRGLTGLGVEVGMARRFEQG